VASHPSGSVAHRDPTHKGADQVHDAMIDGDRFGRNLAISEVFIIFSDCPDNGIAHGKARGTLK
jgi:hypothetical protein